MWSGSHSPAHSVGRLPTPCPGPPQAAASPRHPPGATFWSPRVGGSGTRFPQPYSVGQPALGRAGPGGSAPARPAARRQSREPLGAQPDPQVLLHRVALGGCHRLVTSPPPTWDPVFTAPWEPSDASTTELVQDGLQCSIPALVPVGSPGKDSASPQPPLKPPEIAQLPPPRQLPASSSPLPTDDPGGGREGAGSPNPPRAHLALPARLSLAQPPQPTQHQQRDPRPGPPTSGGTTGGLRWSRAGAAGHGSRPPHVGLSPRCPQPCSNPAGMPPPSQLAPKQPQRDGNPLPLPISAPTAEHLPAHPHHSPQRCWGEPGTGTAGDGTAAERPRHRRVPRLIGTQRGQHPAPAPPGTQRPAAGPPVLTAASSRCPWGLGTRRGQPGQSGARSTAEPAGRGQRSPDLLLLPHHLLSFSLTTARSPRPPTAPPSHASGSPGAQGAGARGSLRHRRARGRVGRTRGTEHGGALGALKVTGRSWGQLRSRHGRLPHRPRGHPSVTSLARSEFDGSQPSPSPGPPAALGLAGVWTRSSRGMSGDAGAASGSRAGAEKGARLPPPAPRWLPHWGYYGKAAARGERAHSRGLPRAASMLPGEISLWFHHPPPAPKEKFLLHARGSSHPLQGQSAGAAPHPQLRPLPSPCTLGAFALVPRVHRGCSAAAGRAALPQPRAWH